MFIKTKNDLRITSTNNAVKWRRQNRNKRKYSNTSFYLGINRRIFRKYVTPKRNNTMKIWQIFEATMMSLQWRTRIYTTEKELDIRHKALFRVDISSTITNISYKELLKPTEQKHNKQNIHIKSCTLSSPHSMIHEHTLKKIVHTELKN